MPCPGGTSSPATSYDFSGYSLAMDDMGIPLMSMPSGSSAPPSGGQSSYGGYKPYSNPPMTTPPTSTGGRTGSSFFDLLTSGYTPGSIERGFQTGFFTPKDSYSVLSNLKIPSGSAPSFQAPRLDFSALQTSKKPLSEVLASIDTAPFQIQIPSIRGGSGAPVSGGKRSRIPLYAGLTVAALAGWIMFKRGRSKGPSPFVAAPK